MELEPFIILVADRDATVGVISAMLLSSALATERRTFDARVRVLIEPESMTGLEAPELPLEIRKIEEDAISATTFDIENANLVVSFSGINFVNLDEIREIGVTAPAVNLCQFVLNLGSRESWSRGLSDIDVREFMVGAALHYGFTGESGECPICADKVGDSIDYCINIADTCARFAQILQGSQK